MPVITLLCDAIRKGRFFRPPDRVGDNDTNWNRTVLGSRVPKLDYLAIHHYYGLAEMHGDDRNLMAPRCTIAGYRQVAQMFRELVPGATLSSRSMNGILLPVPRNIRWESALYAGA